MPNFNCNHCGQNIEADWSLSGTNANCPTCGGAIQVPENPFLTKPSSYNVNNEYDLGKFCIRLLSFKGRIGRIQYLYGFLLNLILIGATIWILKDSLANEGDDIFFPMLILSIVCFFNMWITLSLQVRRLHDMGWSGLWLLTYGVPALGSLIAFIIFISCLATEGNKKPNKYGESAYNIF